MSTLADQDTDGASAIVLADGRTVAFVDGGDPDGHPVIGLHGTPGCRLSRLIDVPKYAGFLQNRVDYRLEDLARCGCETEPLGEILKSLELRPEHPFRIFIKPFMDAWTFDQDRIDRCCTHVIRPDGSLDSFCRYYGK